MYPIIELIITVSMEIGCIGFRFFIVSISDIDTWETEEGIEDEESEIEEREAVRDDITVGFGNDGIESSD